jgi:DNA-binding helix-hairpin-helix protein with protein kinase domain
MPIIFPSGDRLKVINKPIGIGGEGKVFRVANEGANNLVAKIYNKYPDLEQQRKLKTMITMRDQNLLESSAWPDNLLTDSDTGKICGFTMQEVTDSEPLHHIYSPSWRKQNQPFSSWDSLLQLTANLAAVFCIAHSKGVIIGDVNPNSVRVRKNGRVVLIDADSFQITRGSEVLRCRVGVPSFTAPELLAASKSYHSVTREVNHDLFGLSLLIFHVLFMGRHPFAGVFSGSGDTTIESHIKDYHYAYASDYVRRGLSPPPLSINPELVASREIVKLFQNDFTQSGAVQGRTTADEWYKALCFQRERLKRCHANHNHVFDSSNSSCIWCQLEAKGVVFFLSKSSGSQFPPTVSVEEAVDITYLLPSKREELARNKISHLSRQKLVCPIIKPTIYSARHALTDIEKSSILRRSIVRFVSAFMAFVSLALAQSSAIGFAIIVLFFGFGFTPVALQSLLLKFKNELSQVNADLAVAKADASRILSSNKLDDLAASIEASWKTLAELKTQYDIELRPELARLRAQHKDTFLRSYLISDANIYGIGPSRSSTLSSYGIETAADLTSNQLYTISGFGPVLISSLLSWRDSLLRSYTMPSDSLLSKSLQKSLLSKYIPIRQKAGADTIQLCELYDQCYSQTKHKLETIVKSIRVNTNLSESIKSDIQLVNSSAAKIFGRQYRFLVF